MRRSDTLKVSQKEFLTFLKLRHLISVRLIRLLLSAIMLCGTGWSARAAHTQARLLLAADTARPGDTVLAGVSLQMDPHWHTYWKNPGASGMPTSIEWQLPPGVTAGQIQWPIPEKQPEQDLATYIYQDEVVLLVPLKLAPDLPAGPLELKAKVSWLECEVQCIPGRANLQTTLNAGWETNPSKDAALLANWQKKLPKPGAGVSARAWWEKPASGELRPLVLEWTSSAVSPEADFFPDSSEQFEVQPATERLPVDSGKLRLRKQVKKLSGDWPTEIGGLLVEQSGKDRMAYEVKVPIQTAASAAGANSGLSVAAGSAVTAPAVLWKKLLAAFVGGLILNVMPCVLPVIALKILGFVGQAKDEPRRVRKLGLIYALGVLVSFLALASLVIGVKAAGHKAGWGMQFDSPQFLVVLTVLVTLVALNLFGLFEVNPGGRVMNAAGTLASKHGAAGAFFNGVLATVLATPCTAPLLGGALGFAFSQPPPIILLIFLTVGLGLACPYVVLSWHPAWLKLLPKPGAWMEKFKIAMGFPMLATALWLASLLPIHYGQRAWWLGMFLVVVAFAAWVYGQFVQRGRSRRALAAAVVLALLAAGYIEVLEGRLQWRSPVPPDTASAALKVDPQAIPWQPWSPEAVAAGRTQGRPVLVDFTAQWCVTCNFTVKPALESPAVRNKLLELNAMALLADYTRFPAAISEELSRFGRAGVPLVLVYPKNPSEPPIVLPEPLPFRPYQGVVLNALEQAAR
jgi:thiol:disulfide interchange protein